ncbi:MAG TPA: fibronectin type III domain-containing protein [Nocardioidaceae bacterium]|nr:fibronectin type III domain-containing protein [Nocardioidaceae bacterium]
MPKHATTNRVGLLGLVMASVALAPGLSPASARVATVELQPAEVQVVDLPGRERARPRAVAPVGETDDFGVVIQREADPTNRFAGNAEPVLVDGDETSNLDKPVDAVFGNRLVHTPSRNLPAEVVTRLLPGTSWETLGVPDGHELVDYTSDGLLLATPVDGPTPQQLHVLPWSGGELLEVTGLPAGFAVAGAEVARDRHATVLRLTPVAGGTGAKLYVDTSAREAWLLDFAGTACSASSTHPWGLNDGVLAWHGSDAGTHVLCSLPVPSPGDEATQPFAMRHAPTYPGVTSQWFNVAVMPLGETVLVSRHGLGLNQWSADTQLPVYAVQPDGSWNVLDEAAWGHDVRPARPGHVLLTGGPTPQEQAVRRVAADRSSTVLATMSPVRAAYDSVAVDGSRVAFVDDSAVGNAVVQNTLGPDGDWTSSEGEVLDERVDGALVAGAGALAWGSGYPNGTKWAIRSSEGVTTKGSFPHNGSVQGPFRAVSDPWILHEDYWYDSVIDTGSGAVTAVIGTESSWSDLLDGVLYLPNVSVPGARSGIVVARDLATGQAAEIKTPGCSRSSSVQVAGSWMLVHCLDADGKFTAMVYDRTGKVAAFGAPTWVEVVLGDGFLVRRLDDGTLHWYDASLGGGPIVWQPLGDLRTDNPDAFQSLAVSKGTAPTVAWFHRRTAKLATLPVETSPLQPKPVGVTAPSAPVVTAVGRDRSVKLTWPASSPEQRVTAYYVTNVGTGGSPKLLPGDATSHTFSGLTNGKTYNVRVTAINIAGRTDSQVVSATPLAPPARATNIQVEVDPLTSRTRVTWDWTASPNSEPLKGFDVWVDQPFVEGLPTDARSATFEFPQAWTGPVTVESRGTRQSATADSEEVSWPGTDTTAPASSVTDVPKVLLGNALTLRVRAGDDRALAARPVDLRWRTAAAGERLDPWRRPAAWQEIQPGGVRVTKLAAGSTHCFSSRARDHVGNVSAWSPARCTSVAIDDRAMVRQGTWKNLKGSRWFRSTARSSSSVQATLDVGRARAETGWLVATTCPRCGRVQVYIDNGTFGSVNLGSDVRRDRQLLKLPWRMRMGGRVTLRPVANGKPVIVDGIAFRSY